MSRNVMAEGASPPGPAPAVASPADGEAQIDRGPIPFPTQANHPPAREERVRAAAYRRFLERGSEHGDDLQDWLEAEGEVDDEDKPASRLTPVDNPGPAGA